MMKKETGHGTYIDDYGGEYSLDGKTLYHYRQNTLNVAVYKVQEGCEIIGRMAFKNSMLTEIILPDSVTIIRDQAFFGCSQLRRMNVPKSLTVFEMEHSPFPSSFSDLYGWSSHYRNIDGILYNSDKSELLLCYTDRETVAVPSTVKRIAHQAFANRLKLKAIILPNGLKTIGEAAFMGCVALTKIEIPQTVSAIGKRCCWGCHSLQRVEFPQGIKEIPQFAFFSCALKMVNLPYGLTNIGENAFGTNYTLKSIHIPNSVRNIGSSAFEKCIELEEVSLPEQLTTIERSVFEGCKNLKVIDIPSSVHRIKSKAFSDIVNMKVNINTVHSIIVSDNAFENEDFLK